MLGWSINLFKVFGIQLAVHASFFLLLAYAGYEGWRENGTLLGLVVNVGVVVAFFVCVILHELGHSLTARRYGVHVPRILLLPIGGMAEMSHIPKKPAEELWITVAGPAVNFAIAGVLWLIVDMPEGWPLHARYEDSLLGLLHLLLNWNLIMGFFNLLPVFPMDGGRILRAMLARKRPYLEATRRAVIVTRVLAPIFAVVAFFLLKMPMLGALFVFIFFICGAEYRQTLRREEEERYWADMARRVEAARETGTPPPLIARGPIL